METQNGPFSPSDAEIVRQVLEGNVNAFEILLTRYGDLVQRIVKRHVPIHEVEETVQEAVVRVYRSLHTFKEQDRFRQWLSSIAVRTCYDFWRKAYRSQEVPVSAMSEENRDWMEGVISAGSAQSLQDADSRREAAELLEWAMARLSAEDRMVLELIYLEGLSTREASRLLGWSVTNVKVRSFRSRRKLERILGGAVRGEGK